MRPANEYVCRLGFEADLVVRGARGELDDRDAPLVRAHVADCDACRARLYALSEARRTWEALVTETPVIAQRRDLEVVRRFSVGGRRRSRRTFFLGVSLSAPLSVALAALAMVWTGHRSPSPAPVVQLASPPVSVSAVASSPPPVPVPTTASPRPRAARALVVKRPCGGCRADDAPIDVGDSLPDQARVEVPRDAKLLLSFSLAEALTDPDTGLVLEGPARAVVRDDAMQIEEGRARVHARADAVTETMVRTPQATVVILRGRVTIVADDEGTRVKVESGTSRVTTSSGDERELLAGDHGIVRADGVLSIRERAPSAVSSSIPAPTAETVTSTAPTRGEHWSSAMRALDAGDRSAAERELRELLRIATPTDAVYVRASFVVAEIELARGAVIEARPRLEGIIYGPEPQLAEDAASVLARSYASAGERAVVWKKYLDTNPPSPHRERAEAELAASHR